MLVRDLGHREYRLIYAAIAVLMTALAYVLFLEVLEEVVEGSLEPFDQFTVTLIGAFRSDPVTTAAWILHSLLQLPYVLLVIAPVFIYLLRTGRYKMAIAVGAVMFLSLMATLAIKSIVSRPRPETALFQETGASFPSGHAATAVAIYGLIAYVLWRYLVRDTVARLIIIILTTALIIATGLSRIYLLVHYPSDVAAGWAVGAAMLFGAIAVLEFVRKH